MALTLIYCDGWDTIDSLQKTSWDTFGTDCLIDLTGTKSRTGLGCLFIRSAAFGPTKAFPAQNKLLMATAFNPQGSPGLGNKGNIMWLIDSTTNSQQIRIVWNPDLSVSVLNGGDPFPLVLGTSAPNIINPVGYNYITCKCTVGAVGAVQVRVNGAVILTVAGQTSVPGSSGKADTWQLLTFGSLSSYHDDAMIWSWTVAGDDIAVAPNIWPYLPFADDAPLDWTPSVGTDHFALVDSVPQNLTEWNSDGSIGDVDQYIHSLPAAQNSPPFPGTVQILAVQHDLLLEVDSGAAAVGSDVGGIATPGIGLTTGFKAYPFPYTINPVTGLAWTAADFPTLGVGPVVTA